MKEVEWKDLFRVREVRHLLTGATLLASLLVLAASFVAYLAHNDVFERRYTVYAIYEDGKGMSRGAKVLLNGVQVGTVEDVRLDKADARVVLELSLKQRYAEHIHRNAAAYYERDRNMVSDRALNIQKGVPGSPLLRPGDTLVLGPPQDLETALGSLADLTIQFRHTLTRVDSLLMLVTDTHTTIGAVLVKDDLYRKTLTTVDAFNRTAHKTDIVMSRVDRLGTTVESEVPKILFQVDTLTLGLRRTSDVAESLGVSGMQLVRSTRELAEQARGIARRSDTLVGKGARFMNGVENSWLLGRFMKGPSPVPDSANATRPSTGTPSSATK